MAKYITQWSQTYYQGLTSSQHQANNEWFQQQAMMLKPGGVIIVPNLGYTSFTSDGRTWAEA